MRISVVLDTEAEIKRIWQIYEKLEAFGFHLGLFEVLRVQTGRAQLVITCNNLLCRASDKLLSLESISTGLIVFFFFTTFQQSIHKFLQFVFSKNEYLLEIFPFHSYILFNNRKKNQRKNIG